MPVRAPRAFTSVVVVDDRSQSRACRGRHRTRRRRGESGRLGATSRSAIRFASAEEAAALPLRKESVRTGTLRLIEVPDFDISACGGTHVARTGAIGAVAIASSERFRGGTRVEFLCGVRATARLPGAARHGGRERSARLGAADRTAAGIERLQAEMKDIKRSAQDLQHRLAAFEGVVSGGSRRSARDIQGVIAAIEGWDQAGLKALAGEIVSRSNYLAALFSVPAPSSVVVVRSADVTVDCAAVLKKTDRTVRRQRAADGRTWRRAAGFRGRQTKSSLPRESSSDKSCNGGAHQSAHRPAASPADTPASRATSGSESPAAFRSAGRAVAASAPKDPIAVAADRLHVDRRDPSSGDQRVHGVGAPLVDDAQIGDRDGAHSGIGIGRRHRSGAGRPRGRRVAPAL